MTTTVGIDLVSADEVRDSIRDHGDQYLQRVYTDTEISDCTGPGAVDAARLAARFAAKEATFKALGVGSQAVSWRDVEVLRGARGEAELSLSGQAAAFARTAGITHLALSITHERECAAAVVIAEIAESADREISEPADR